MNSKWNVLARKSPETVRITNRITVSILKIKVTIQLSPDEQTGRSKY
jgi:hypothetical protein